MSHQPATTSEDQEPHVDLYELLGSIGHGIHAKVKLGRHLPTKTWVAIKIIKKEDSIMQQRPILEEVLCMARLRHPNIVKLFQMINTKDSLFIIMERVTGGNMQDYLLINGRMTEGEARGSFRQLVSAVHYCHEQGVIHRDLKPQNVLLDPEMNVKLTDFGVSSFYRENKLSTFCGSPAYLAPEIFQKEEYDGPPVDIWSLGVMLYKMVTGTVPFKGKHLIELGKRIVKGTYTVPSYLTAELHTLLHKLITMDPRDRSTLKQIMPDQWLNMDHVEELTPYIQPPSEELDPEVTQEMINMGFKLEDIQRALTKKSYSKVKGTYLMLSTKKSAAPHRIIRVRPYQATDLSSIISSPDQEAQTESSRRPPVPEESTTTTIRVRPYQATDLSSIISSPDQEAQTESSRRPPEPEKSTTTTIRVRPYQATDLSSIISSPDQEAQTESSRRPPVPEESTTTTIRVRPYQATDLSSIISSPDQEAQTESSRRPPVPEESTTTTIRVRPYQATDLSSIISSPDQEAQTESSRRPPVPDESTTTTIRVRPYQATDLSSIISSPDQEAQTESSRRPPVPEESTTTTRPPKRESESKNITPPCNHTPESKKATSRPPPKFGPGDSPSTHNTSSRSGGSPEEKSQGRKGVARRCLDFLRKLCLRPFKKGLGKPNRVKPS